MPNPLLKVQLNRSKSRVDRPEPIPPVAENQYADDNIPYRGIETHGVPIGNPDFDDPDVYVVGDGRPVIVYDEEEDDREPIPVRIVSSGSREYRRFRTDRMTVGGTGNAQVVQVVGKNDARTNLKIRNMSADKTLYIASDQADVMITGYPLTAGQEFTTTAESPVYAYSVDGSSVTVAVYYEYAVRE